MIRSTLVYLIRNGQWLMLLRNRKEHDVNHGKWIGVGGKSLPGETQEECAIRETLEETGYLCTPEYRGRLQFRYEGEESEDISVYTSQRFTGTFHDTEEGTLAWIDEDRILDLELWPGDRLFLERILKGKTGIFSYILEYDSSGRLLRAEEEPEYE